jgi:pseudouridine kinase
LRSPLLSGANSRTAHLTRPTADSHHGRERHLNFKFIHPGRAYGQLIGIMAALFWRTKAAICAAASWNRERRMNSTNQMIACIGGIVLDRKARVEGGARPGTSNPVSVTTSTGGVAANIARNLARLGCRVSLFSILGADDSGATAIRELENSGVNASAILRSRTHPTASYTAVLEPNGELFIGLADMDIFEELDPAWSDRIAPGLAQCPVWIVDTNLPAKTIERLLMTHKGNATVLADPISIIKSERIRSSLAAVDVLFPNRKEAAVLSGFDVHTPRDVAEAASEIRKRGVGTVVVTLGGDGIYLDAGRGGKFLPVIPAKRVLDVTGAGDALVAGYAYGMLAGGNREPALFGLAAASLTVETEKSIAEDLQPERLLERMNSAPSRTNT